MTTRKELEDYIALMDEAIEQWPDIIRKNPDRAEELSAAMGLAKQHRALAKQALDEMDK
jgi:hypothetical protein